MIELLRQTESPPSVYPAVALYAQDDTNGMTGVDAREVDVAIVWQRIEAYIAYRWTPRDVVWVIEANRGDEWLPPLAPIVSLSGERWTGATWEAVALAEAPEGYALPSDGRFRITATVGAGYPPAAVEEAVRRLHEYSIGIAQQFKAFDAIQNDGVVGAWAAKGLQLSGAADLLRPYRRA